MLDLEQFDSSLALELFVKLCSDDFVLINRYQ